MEELLALTEPALETLLKRLTHHALCKMRCLTWRGAYVVRGGTVPGGYEPYDFALDAIQKFLDGTRTWNRDAYPTLEKALRATIDSDINHLVDSEENKKTRRPTPRSPEDKLSPDFERPGTEPDPLTLVIDKEWQDRYHKAALKELDGDKSLAAIFECLEAEITEPKDIAMMLGIEVDEVNNGKRRLRRKLEKLDAKFHPRKQRVT